MIEDIMAPASQPIKRSKQQRLGQELIERIYKKNINAGGSFSSILGAPGAGKTSGMLSLCNMIMKKNPSELIYWSSSYGAPLQFFPIYKYHILVKEGMDITFFDRFKNEEVNLQVTTFTDFEDLYNKSKTGCLNCVFFGDRSVWMSWTEFLMSKGGWHTIAFDEISEITPSFTGGQMFKRIGYFANHVVGQTRKCGITILSNTQSPVDTDYRVRKKLNMFIFFAGSRIPKNATRVTQKAVDNLREDHINGSQCYISAGGRFGVIRFTDIFTPLPNWSVEARSPYRSEINYGIETPEQATNSNDTRRCSSESNRVNEPNQFEDFRNTLPC